MEAPFGITFLKKAEFYNLICRLDQQEKDTRDPSNALWPVEKRILKWTYSYHKHLGIQLVQIIFPETQSGAN